MTGRQIIRAVDVDKSDKHRTKNSFKSLQKTSNRIASNSGNGTNNNTGNNSSGTNTPAAVSGSQSPRKIAGSNMAEPLPGIMEIEDI